MLLNQPQSATERAEGPTMNGGAELFVFEKQDKTKQEFPAGFVDCEKRQNQGQRHKDKESRTEQGWEEAKNGCGGTSRQGRAWGPGERLALVTKGLDVSPEARREGGGWVGRQISQQPGPGGKSREFPPDGFAK